MYDFEEEKWVSDVFDGVEIPIEEPGDEDWKEFEFKCSQEKCEDEAVPRGEITPCVITFKMKDEDIPVPIPDCPYGGEFTVED